MDKLGFKRNQTGFTLVEIVIVVTILGILAAVVAVSVLGMMGKGRNESYLTDENTLYRIVTAFYTDQHNYSSINGWNEKSDISSIKNYPIGNPGNQSALDLYLGDLVPLAGYNVYIVMDPTENEAADDADIMAAAIWMGLLMNGPGYGDVVGAGPDEAPGDFNSPLSEENGPYLNPLPESCGNLNYSKGSGTYTWIMGDNGKVYGVFKEGANWYAGFNGHYP